MNNVSLVGRFAKDPELRYTPNGKAVANFTLAVRNPFDPDGNADFIQCVAWGAGAELIAEKHEKGNMIGVDGRISTRNYENNEGRTVYVTEVNVNSIHLIQTKDYAENQQNDSNKGNKGNTNKGNGNKGNRNGNR
jgi:single-strand DNA-binding protein